MNNKFKAIIFTLAAILAFSMASCTGNGGKSLNSAEALKAYLDKQPANTPDKPIKVAVTANALTLPNIVETINSSGKYVSLSFSGNALTVIPDKAFYDDSTYKDCETLISITIPDKRKMTHFTQLQS